MFSSGEKLEQQVILLDEGTQLGEVGPLHLVPVAHDFAAEVGTDRGHAVRKHVEEGALATARWTHDGDKFARSNMPTAVMENLLLSPGLLILHKVVQITPLDVGTLAVLLLWVKVKVSVHC